MKLNNHGLTVGELTIAISVLIILGLIWTTLGKKQEVQETSLMRNIEGISLNLEESL